MKITDIYFYKNSTENSLSILFGQNYNENQARTNYLHSCLCLSTTKGRDIKMIKSPILTKLTYNVFEYMIALAFILECRSSWLTFTSTKDWFNNFVLLLLLFGIFGCICTTKINKFDMQKTFIFSVIEGLYFFIYIFFQPVNRNTSIKFMIICVAITVYYFLCCKEEKIPSILKKYATLMFIIAILSLFFWVMGSILHIIESTGTKWTTWTGTGKEMEIPSYLGIYFERQVYEPLNIIRNSAFFSEAPMFSLNLSFAFLIEFLLKEKPSKIKCAIYIISIISTIAFTGYILIICIFFTKYFYNATKSKILFILKFICTPILALIALSFCYILLTHKLQTSSGLVRINDFIVGYKAWKQNILFGAGLSNDQAIKALMPAWRSSNTGFSNSPTQILAHGGIYIAMPYLLGFGTGIINALKAEKNMIIFVTACLALFSITICSYEYIILYLLIWFTFPFINKTI